MKNRIACVLIGIASLLSCSKNEVISQLPDDSAKDSNTIQPHEALSSLEEMLGEVGTKSSAGLSADDLFVIGKNDLSAETKSTSVLDVPDTLLYALNFKDGGFALMAANTKINSPVLCITESGTIGYENIHDAMKFLEETKSDGTKADEYTGDEVFVDAGQTYVYSLLMSSAIIDYFDNESLAKDSPLTKDSGVKKYGPYLKTKWTQGKPFNNLTPGNYDAGCVVIAVAQIMAYNERPASCEFITPSIPWSLHKTVYPYNNIYSMGSENSQFAVALMSMVLGNNDNCAVTYSPSGSGSTANKARTTFENYGYNVTKRIGCHAVDKRKIEEQIAAGRPVYMDGSRNGGGHAWVIDGLDGDYYHINWGWQGDCDGYYYKGTFNTSERAWYDNVYDPGIAFSTGRDYYHYFNILLYTSIVR